MSVTRTTVVRCDGCGKETGDPQWWVKAHTETASVSGITCDVLIVDRDYCEQCWQTMRSSVRMSEAKQEK